MQAVQRDEWNEICCLPVTVQCGDGSGDKIGFVGVFVRDPDHHVVTT